MKVYIKVGLETATHKLEKGKIYDLQSAEARRLIELKIARHLSKKEIKNDS